MSVEDDGFIRISADGPIKVGPPMVTIDSTALGRVDIVNPIAVDMTLNTATCAEDCDCETPGGATTYLVMLEVEVDEQEYRRLSDSSGWLNPDQEDE